MDYGSSHEDDRVMGHLTALLDPLTQLIKIYIQYKKCGRAQPTRNSWITPNCVRSNTPLPFAPTEQKVRLR